MLKKPAESITALVAVENEEYRAAITRTLQNQMGSNRLAACATAKRALRLFDAAGPFDIAIIDHALPDEDGLALLRHLLEKKAAGRLLFVTQPGNEKAAAEAMSAGADLFMLMDNGMGFLKLLPLLISHLLQPASLQMASGRQVKSEGIPAAADLERRINALREANRSLKMLLSNHRRDKKGLEDKISANIQRLVIPYVQKLNDTQLDSRQKLYLNLVRESLQEIVEPFLSRLSSRHANLTATEIKVAWLIKEGKSTPQIARVLSSSKGAINFHRNNIRKKTGLRNKKINLRTYLLTLS